MSEESTLAHLSSPDAALVREELALHQRVKEAVRDAALAKSPDMSGIQTRLKELRDEAISANEHDLPALFQQLYTHHSLAARTFETKLPDMRAPYFARVRLVEKGKARDVLIGYQTFIDQNAGVTIIDWRHAALAKVFFNFREGEEYELELPGRLANGILAVRRVIAFDVGELVGITGADFALARDRGGDWQRHEHTGVAKFAGGEGKAVNAASFGSGGPQRKLPDVSALLDPDQYAILTREDEGALLILGGAGSGKTTIALHRMAHLNYLKPRMYEPRAMRVVVPEQGLVRLTERLLKNLGMNGVGVDTFDAWVTDQAQHILKGIPKRICEWTPSAALTIKRHPAMYDVVDAYIGLLTERIANRIAFLFDELAPFSGAFRADQAALWPRLEAFESRLKAVIDALPDEKTRSWRRNTAMTFFKEARDILLDVETARSDLFTNPDLLKVSVAHGGGLITTKACEELVRHTRKQFVDAKAQEIDIVDEDDGRTVDGQELERDEYAGTIDVEDYAVLLYLMLRIHGRVLRKGKSLTLYRHLLIDEAQDLAPVELKVLGQALHDDSTLTVAGDAAQQSDPNVVFRSWDDVMDQLGGGVVSEARLQTNYRCPRPIAELGHKVLGPDAPSEMPRSIRDGAEVVYSHFPNEGLAVVALTDALTQLFERERHASVAVICESQETARRYAENLKNVDDVHLVIDGEFEFRPGVDVTDVSQVKGLEFDYVIIPDATEHAYPDTPVARRSLHIAITRTVHQLWVISVGRPSPLIKS